MTLDAAARFGDVKVRHVLVPLDGSELSLRALPTARALAERFGAAVHTISVAGSESDAARLRALAAAVLDADTGDETVTVAIGGDPAQAIGQRSDELDSTLVCMSTHGRGRLSGAMIGSVARSVLQGSDEPMVILGPMADNPMWTPKPRRWPEPLSVPRIVACVDGSETSEQILPIAAAWASAFAMSMTILTIAQDSPPPVLRENRDKGYGSDPDADTYIEELVRKWNGTAMKVDGEVFRDPISAASGVRMYLDSQPAGMVALTTHARSGTERVLLGATAASIVHASVSPCLVAPVRA